MIPHPAWQTCPDTGNARLDLGQWDVAVYERQAKWYVRFGPRTWKHAYTSAAEAMLAGEGLAREVLERALEELGRGE